MVKSRRGAGNEVMSIYIFDRFLAVHKPHTAINEQMCAVHVHKHAPHTAIKLNGGPCTAIDVPRRRP